MDRYPENYNDFNNYNIRGLHRYIGQTVTIFTSSGGLSGSGFTGVLVDVDADTVTILVSFGAAPACPLGSACDPIKTVAHNGNPLGAVAVIPVRAIVAFTHHAI